MASLLAAFLLSAKGQGLKVPQPYSSSTALGGVGPATAHTPTHNPLGQGNPRCPLPLRARAWRVASRVCTWGAVASWPCSPHWEFEKGELRILELRILEKVFFSELPTHSRSTACKTLHLIAGWTLPRKAARAIKLNTCE